jgi:hypothetical protein
MSEITIQTAHRECLALRRQLDAALRERDCLRAALERYGRHEAGPDGCRYEGRGFGGAPCTCGLAALLEVKETPGSEEPPGEE